MVHRPIPNQDERIVPMPAATVLISVPKLADEGMTRLAEAGVRTIFMKQGASDADLAATLASEPVDALVLRTLGLGGAAIRGCPTLKVISRHGSGYNGVDIATASACRIPVFIAPAANSQSVAELAVGLMLAVARTIPAHDAAFRRGEWHRSTVGTQLGGRTLGLIGIGAIGSRVATVAQALGMTVVAFDRFVAPDKVPPGVTLVPTLDEMLPRADMLSIHCPLTPDTTGLVGRDALARLPRGAILINTARGPLVDETALVEALASGHLGGAGLDTLIDEPPAAGSPFRSMPNVVITPHVGGNTRAALGAVAAVAVDNALRFLRGEAVDRRLCINPDVLDGKDE